MVVGVESCEQSKSSAVAKARDGETASVCVCAATEAFQVSQQQPTSTWQLSTSNLTQLQLNHLVQGSTIGRSTSYSSSASYSSSELFWVSAASTRTFLRTPRLLTNALYQAIPRSQTTPSSKPISRLSWVIQMPLTWTQTPQHQISICSSA